MLNSESERDAAAAQRVGRRLWRKGQPAATQQPAHEVVDLTGDGGGAAAGGSGDGDRRRPTQQAPAALVTPVRQPPARRTAADNSPQATLQRRTSGRRQPASARKQRNAAALERLRAGQGGVADLPSGEGAPGDRCALMLRTNNTCGHRLMWFGSAAA